MVRARLRVIVKALRDKAEHIADRLRSASTHGPSASRRVLNRRPLHRSSPCLSPTAVPLVVHRDTLGPEPVSTEGEGIPRD